MEIRRADISDARSVAEIHVSGWRAAYGGLIPNEHLDSLSASKREAYWLEAIRRGNPDLVVARDSSDVVGWAAFGPCRDEDAPSARAELYAIYVAPRHWSKGVGRALWLHVRSTLAKKFTEISLWVLVGNLRAIRFYVAAGFVSESATAKTVKYAGESLTEVRYVAQLSD